MKESKENNADRKTDEAPKSLLRRIWPFSTIARRYDTFVARLKADVAYDAKLSLEEVFASAKEEAKRDLERNYTSVSSAMGEVEKAATELKRTVYAKAGELRDGLKEAKNSADAATGAVKDFSIRLTKVEEEYNDVRTRNDQNKKVIDNATASLTGAKAALEAAEKKHLLVLSAAEAANKAYTEALRQTNEAQSLLAKFPDLQKCVETAIEESKTSRENLESEFKAREAEQFRELQRGACFFGMPPMQKQLLIELAVNFDYDIGAFRKSAEDMRARAKGKPAASILQRIYTDSQILELLITRASKDKMELEEFARVGVEILREHDSEFRESYEAAKGYKQRNVKPRK